MVSYIKSVCREVNLAACEFNEQDRYVDRETGKKMTRNWLPIGTGTLFKANVVATVALFLFLVPSTATGCYLDENASRCIALNHVMQMLEYGMPGVISFQAYRMFRNNPS